SPTITSPKKASMASTDLVAHEAAETVLWPPIGSIVVILSQTRSVTDGGTAVVAVGVAAAVPRPARVMKSNKGNTRNVRMAALMNSTLNFSPCPHNAPLTLLLTHRAAGPSRASPE